MQLIITIIIKNSAAIIINFVPNATNAMSNLPKWTVCTFKPIESSSN